MNLFYSVREKAKILLQPGEGLYQRTIRSGFWVFALRITEQLFNIVRLIILARVLAPNDFGLMGIALLSLASLETFTQTGFQQALIQKKEDISSYLDTAWTVMLLRNILLCIILFFTAPYIALFFGTPAAVGIIRAIGFSLLLGGSGGIGGFVNIGIIYFQKELEFNKQFLWRVSGTLADFIVSVATALILRSVWALVFGLLAGNLVRLIMSYYTHPYRPRLRFDRAKSRELFGFGKWILGSSILIFLLTQGDDIFVGKLLGATALGLYQMAYSISNAPATEITHVISQVTFPAYAKLQDNLPGLKDAYLKTLQLTAFISCPIAAGIFILAPEFTKIFLGDKWLPMVPAMKILCIFGLTRAISALIGSFFQGIGKPAIQTIIGVIQLAIMMLAIYPLTLYWGLLGVSLVVTIPNVFAFIYMNVKLTKMICCHFLRWIKMLLYPIISSLLMVSVSHVFQVWGDGNLENFFASIVLGIITYAVIIQLIDIKCDYGLKKNIMEAFISVFQ
jgi:O-antigen/teichoic acid export membrane protein